MNTFLDAQCKSMIAAMNAYENTCKMAVTKDDGIVSAEEKKALYKISKAIEKFRKNIEKIKIP